jgi:hypothetical protein
MPTDDPELEKSYDETLPKAGENGAGAGAPQGNGAAAHAPSSIDPSDVFKDMGNPDKDEAEPQADGFTEEELW